MTHGRFARGRTIAAAVLIVAAACSNQPAQITPAACAPYDGERVLDVAAIADLAGNFQLSLVATSGARSGQTAGGTLTLIENGSEFRDVMDVGGVPLAGVVAPFYGSADVDVTEVGALPLGTAASDDPQQPGVLVVQDNAGGTGSPRSLVMRVGSAANQRNQTPFDGGYTALRVRYVSRDSILGSWASGTVTETAAGFFCAARR